MSSTFVAIIVVCITAAVAPVSNCLATRYTVNQQHSDASDENPGTEEQPLKTIGGATSLIKAGDLVIVHQGIYRENIAIPEGKPQLPVSIEAATGERVVISGANVVNQWRPYASEDAPTDAQIWVHQPWNHVWIGWNKNMSHGAPPPIGRSEQVIVDEELLKPVLSIKEMIPGTFLADPKETQALYVRLHNDDSPDQHTVEASVRDTLLTAPDYTQVRGLVFRYAANRAQQGAVHIDGKQVVFEDCVVEWTNGSGIRVGGENFILRRTVSRSNGQLGLGGSGKNFLIEACTFENNNVKGFPAGWEGGGFKIVHSWGAKIERCQAIGNHGPGMWFDIDNFAGEVRQCYVANNDNSGIFIEISGDFLITDNLCVNNGGRTNGDWAGAGISIGESRDCYVAFNTCVDNQYGISVRGQVPRKQGERIYKNQNITIRNNILAHNEKAQFGLMWDAAFMGKHPSQKDLSEAQWQEQLKDAVNPDEIGLMLNYNCYVRGEVSELIRWGVGWRPKSQSYVDLDSLEKEHGLERRGRIIESPFVSLVGGDFESIKKRGLTLSGVLFSTSTEFSGLDEMTKCSSRHIEDFSDRSLGYPFGQKQPNFLFPPIKTRFSKAPFRSAENLSLFPSLC